MCKPKVNRWYVRCVDCLHTSAVDAESLPRSALACGACGGRIENMGRVSGCSLVHDGLRCACDGRCTGAMGPNCDCQCGGVNHGTGRVVPIEIPAGGVPIIRNPDSEALKERAREWRETLAEVENRAAAMRAGSRWLSDADYHTVYRLEKYARNARTLRTHAGRMACLRKVLEPAKV